MAILKATNLSRVYGEHEAAATTWALRDASLTVEAGEFIGVMGPSGSGKTTLLNLLAAIDTPTAGKVEINGTDISKLSDRDLAVFRRRNLGFIFQDYNLLHTLSVQENVVLPLALEGLSPQLILSRLHEVARQLGIEAILPKRVYQLSGGEQQRTAIARAIIHRPSLILADEPTGNLDSKSSASVMKALSDLNAWATVEPGTDGTAGRGGGRVIGAASGTNACDAGGSSSAATILMVTHDPFAASFCRRILFIKDGRIQSELHRRGSRQAFYQEILDVLTTQGGADLDLTAARA
ncbi:MAG: ABC transporter ATP-binding protein [Bacillota bacterium]